MNSLGVELVTLRLLHALLMTKPLRRFDTFPCGLVENLNIIYSKIAFPRPTLEEIPPTLSFPFGFSSM